MGLSLFSSSCTCDNCTSTIIKNPNPDPSNFRITGVSSENGFHIIEVTYPDCTNFEGSKILVYYGTKLEDIFDAKELDPHFCDGDHISPIARFEPTERGWHWAYDFIKNAKAPIYKK